MIDLKNITLKGSVVSATVIIIQTHPEQFEITVDIKEQQVISCSRECTDMYVCQAIAKLVNLYKEYGTHMPKTSQSVWY